MGEFVTCGGDVNGDGIDDFLISSHYDRGGKSAVGALSLFLSPHDARFEARRVPIQDADVQYVGEYEAGALSLSNILGDVDWDGYDDILMCAPDSVHDDEGTTRGVCYLFYGSPSMSAEAAVGVETADVIFKGNNSLEPFKQEYGVGKPKGLGDLNGDGYADFGILSSFSDRGGENSGAAYIFYGPLEHSSYTFDQADLSFIGEEAYDFMDEIEVGDLNSDGHLDLVISATESYSWQVPGNGGVVYVFYGPGLNLGQETIIRSVTEADVTIHGRVDAVEWEDEPTRYNGTHFGESIAPLASSTDGGHPTLLVGASADRPNGKIYEYILSQNTDVSLTHEDAKSVLDYPDASAVGFELDTISNFRSTHSNSFMTRANIFTETGTYKREVHLYTSDIQTAIPTLTYRFIHTDGTVFTEEMVYTCKLSSQPRHYLLFGGGLGSFPSGGGGGSATIIKPIPEEP